MHWLLLPGTNTCTRAGRGLQAICFFFFTGICSTFFVYYDGGHGQVQGIYETYGKLGGILVLVGVLVEVALQFAQTR